jgi:hypothetical protein
MISFVLSSLRINGYHPSGKKLIVGPVSQKGRIIKAVWETAPTFFDKEPLNFGII